MADERNKKCAHERCSCPATGDSDYCSPACEAMGNNDMTTIACDCGHAGCAGEV